MLGINVIRNIIALRITEVSSRGIIEEFGQDHRVNITELGKILKIKMR